MVLITRTSKVPYGHTATRAAQVSRAAVANDEGVCIPAPLLFHRLETLTQINRQHGPAITISASPLLPASLHSRLLLPTSALISRLQSLSRSSSPCLCWRPRSHFLSSPLATSSHPHPPQPDLFFLPRLPLSSFSSSPSPSLLSRFSLHFSLTYPLISPHLLFPSPPYSPPVISPTPALPLSPGLFFSAGSNILLPLCLSLLSSLHFSYLPLVYLGWLASF